jgi:hypothetical protein
LVVPLQVGVAACAEEGNARRPAVKEARLDLWNRSFMVFSLAFRVETEGLAAVRGRKLSLRQVGFMAGGCGDAMDCWWILLLA